MSVPFIQLEGTIKIGPTGSLVDYSAAITSLTITKTRQLVTRPATFADARETQHAGPESDTITINFLNDEAASGFWVELWDAINTDSAELDFDALYKPGAVGASNPRYTGRFVVAQLDQGGDVGALAQQRQTYPVLSLTRAIA
jgi:hypothetical protein